MISVEDCAEMETESLRKYVENSNERLLKAVEVEGFYEMEILRKKSWKREGRFSWKNHCIHSLW